MKALGPVKSRLSNPYGFLAASAPGAVAQDMPSREDLLRRLLPSAPPEQSSAASRRSEMMRQDYAPPAPAVPDYPPIRGTGYRIPIIPPPDTADDPLDALSGYGSGGKRKLPGASFSGTPPLEPPFDLGPDQPVYRLGPIPPVPKPEAGIVPSVTRIGRAARDAVRELFEPPLGISRESLGSLVAQTPEETRGVAGLIRGFNGILLSDGSAALDAASRAMLAPIAGGIAAIGQAAQEAGMSRTDARRLERDLNALAVSLGVVTGASMGGRPRVPRPERILAEANARGMLDAALLDLPREGRLAAKQRLREAFKEGQKVGEEAAKTQRAPNAPRKADSGPTSAAANLGSKPPLTRLPPESKAMNPMTVEEFENLPQNGTVDPNSIRTLQTGISPVFKLDAVTQTKPSLIDTTNQLRANPAYSEKLPPIRIFVHENGVYALDHRRLVAHRLAGVPARYRKATQQEVAKELPDKMDSSRDNGITIKIRPERAKREANDR